MVTEQLLWRCSEPQVIQFCPACLDAKGRSGKESQQKINSSTYDYTYFENGYHLQRNWKSRVY